MTTKRASVESTADAYLELLAAREQLANLLKYMDGKAAAEDGLKKLLADPQLMAALKSNLEQKSPGGPSSQDAK